MSHRYDIYGLVVDSDVELHLGRAASPEREPDLVIRRDPRPVPTGALVGRLVLEHVADDGRWYHAVERDDGAMVLRFDDLCDMELAADGRHAAWRLAPGGDAGVAGVLVAGAFLAFVLTWRGDLVLHGSAVDLRRSDDDGTGPSTIGFVGRSGMGKSTMATLLCRAGGRLVTDDILVVDPVDPATGMRVPRSGAVETRLRPGAATLVDELGAAGSPVRTSGDDRRVLRLAGETGPVPGGLAALVVPLPDRTHDVLRLHRLTTREAVVALLRFPRLSQWLDHSVSARHFAELAALAADVPVLLAHVPWGPPFRRDVVQELIETVLTGDLPDPAPVFGASGQRVVPV